MKHIILAALLLAAMIPYSYDLDYFAHTSRIYYPDNYLSPARTGMPNKAYYYPRTYADTFGSFRDYRQYTHRAIRDTHRMRYHTPYAGKINQHYYR